MTTDSSSGAIQVVLRQADGKIDCEVTWLDEEATGHELEATSLRHAKHEVKAWLTGDGWVPVDRWRRTGSDRSQIMRHFRRPPANDRLFPTVR